MKQIIVTFAALLTLTAGAYAHGGAYRGPSWPPTPQVPSTPNSGPPVPTTGGGPTPTTGGGGGVITGGHTPTAGGGPKLPPSTSGPRTPGSRRVPPATPHPEDWSYWWHLNREPLLEIAKLEKERIRAADDAESSPVFRGTNGAPTAGADGSKGRTVLLSALRAACLDSNKDVATGAIIALGKAEDGKSIPLFERLARSSHVDHTVNESAALALGMIGKDPAAVRSFLVALAEDGKVAGRTRGFAELGLGLLGDVGAVPSLMKLSRVTEGTRNVPACALIALGLLGEKIVEPDLAERVSGRRERDRSPLLRAYAAAALGDLGDPAAIPALVKALADKAADVRRQAVLSLGALAGPKNEEVLEALANVLDSDPDQQCRGFAAVSIGRIGAPELAQLLLSKAGRGSPQISGYATLGVAFLVRRSGDAATAEKVLPHLRRWLAVAANHDLKGALALAAGIARDQQSVPTLLKMFEKVRDPLLRSRIAVALGLLGSKKALPGLRAAIGKRSNPDVLRSVALALALLGDRKSIGALQKLVDHGASDYVRGGAAVALGRLATPAAAESLANLLADSSRPPRNRAFAAVALGLVLDPRDHPILARIGEDFDHRMSFGAMTEVLTFL